MLKLFVSMQTYVTGVLNRDRGATAVEYGLLVGLIAVVIIAVVIVLGNKLNALFTSHRQLAAAAHLLIREFARRLPSTRRRWTEARAMDPTPERSSPR